MKCVAMIHQKHSRIGKIIALNGDVKVVSRMVTKKQSAQLKPLRAQGQNPETAISFTLVNYLELVDWSGRIIRPNKRGHILQDVPPILDRLGIDPDEWLKTMAWNNRFYRAVGRLQSIGRTQNKQDSNGCRGWRHVVVCFQAKLEFNPDFSFITTTCHTQPTAGKVDSYCLR